MKNDLEEFINKKYKSVPITEKESFNFTCAEKCWGTCCREHHVGLLQLSVYDVYKLLEKRTDLPTLDLIQVKIEEDSNLPRAYIKWNEKAECPNLDESGACMVYMERPFACRIFPLEAKFMIDDSSHKVSVDYCVKEKVCFGFHKEANPVEQKLERFLDTLDFKNHLQFEEKEVSLRDKWIKEYRLKELSNQQVHMLAQVLYCLKDKVVGKNTYFFDMYSEMLKIPKRTKRLESFKAYELATLALEEFTPRLLKKFKSK